MALAGQKFILKTVLDAVKAVQDDLPVAGDFTTLGGFQSNGLELSASDIETTTKDDNQNRTLLDRQGIISLTASGEGILPDSINNRLLEQSFIDQKLRWFAIERPDGRTFYAKFKATAYNSTGSFAGAVNFSITLMSSGAVYIVDSDGFSYNTKTDKITAFPGLLNTFNYFLFRSPTYLPAQIPAAGNARLTALNTFMTSQTITNANKIAGTPTGAINLTGPPAAGNTGKFSFPIILLQKSVIENKRVQILGPADESITFRLMQIGDFKDNTNVDWRAFWLDFLLGVAETSKIKVNIG